MNVERRRQDPSEDDVNDQPPSQDEEVPAQPPEHEEQGGGQEVESRARSMGWVSKEEFRGNPDDWRDAGEFVRRGEEELPILRERNRTLTRRIDKIERTHQDQFSRLERMTDVALQRQRDQISNSYEQAKFTAAESGDAERYNQLTQDQQEALRIHDESYQEPAPQGGQDPRQPQQPGGQQAGNGRWTQADMDYGDRWAEQNGWVQDPVLGSLAIAYHKQLQHEQPGLSIEQNLHEVGRRVRERFPEKFGVKPPEPSAVEGGGRGVRRQGKGVADLPADAKRQGQKFVEEGLFKSLEDYAKEYHGLPERPQL